VRVALSEEDLPCLEAEIGALLEEWRGDPFLIDGPEKLHRVVQYYRAHLGLCEPVAPRCNAPWVSAVIETGGVVRPCFFLSARWSCGTRIGVCGEQPRGAGIPRQP
jgi:Fe-coproporphyrin III synthase